MAEATSVLSRVKQELFLDSIITGDETWISNDNIICRIQWLDKGLKKAKQTYKIRKQTFMGKNICVCGGIGLI